MSASAGAAVSVETLELLVELLSQTEEGPGQRFYDRLCEGVCRQARMRRAVIFRYDSASRRVRAAGAHGLDLAQFTDAHVSVESAPITAEALRLDRVVEFDGDFRTQIPPEFSALFDGPVRLVCAPMIAGARAIGVILADRTLDAPPLDEAERDLLWTFGKAAALASIARIVATQAEKARQLEQRIDLAREIHEGVIQRLFGVSMALDGEGDLPARARVRCAAETQSALSDLPARARVRCAAETQTALSDLRSALQRPLARLPRATETTLQDEVRRLARAHREFDVTLEAVGAAEVPASLEPLAQSVLIEAVRNARKHAQPTEVTVRVDRREETFLLEVLNDGVLSGQRHQPGMGLRLAALEALQSGGVVEFGERKPGMWQVRLVVPYGEDQP